MLNDLVPIVLFLCFYFIVSQMLKNSNRVKILKILTENNLLNGDNASAKINIDQIDASSSGKNRKNILLPLALGGMGFGIGAFVSAIMIICLRRGGFDLAVRPFNLLEGAPVFIFTSLGLLISYFIARKEEKSEK